MDVFILYRDMSTYGMLEDYYTEARDKGVIFSRFDPEQLPQVHVDGRQLSVTFMDHVLERPVTMPVDAVILSAATLANDTEELASLLKIPRNAEGFFIEAHAKLRPVDFASEGIYLCGTAHSPKLISESIAQALAAASRAGAFLADATRPSAGSWPTWSRSAAPPAWCASAAAPTGCRRSTGTTSRKSTRRCARVAASAPRSVRPR